MAHEQSETGSTPFGAVNVYGRKTKNAGRVLPPIFQFERQSYPDIRTAANAAAARSRLTDVAGWNPSLSDLLRSNPQIGEPLPVGTAADVESGHVYSPLEMARLYAAAEKHGIDPRLLKSLAMVERGPQVKGPEGPTTGLGVISVPAPTLREQADIAGRTILNTLSRYRNAFGKEPIDASGRYTEDFLRYFSRGGPGYPGYAPLKAKNDPRNLNQHHLRRLLEFYGKDTGTKNLSELIPAILGRPR